MKYGNSAETLNKVNVAELDGLIKAMQSGKKADANVQVETAVVAPASAKPATVRRRDLTAE